MSRHLYLTSADESGRGRARARQPSPRRIGSPRPGPGPDGGPAPARRHEHERDRRVRLRRPALPAEVLGPPVDDAFLAVNRAPGSARPAPPRGSPSRARGDCVDTGGRRATPAEEALDYLADLGRLWARTTAEGRRALALATFARLGAVPERIVDIDVAPFAAARELVLALPTRVDGGGRYWTRTSDILGVSEAL
jgi:hypothetical protein